MEDQNICGGQCYIDSSLQKVKKSSTDTKEIQKQEKLSFDWFFEESSSICNSTFTLSNPKQFFGIFKQQLVVSPILDIWQPPRLV